MGLRGIPSSRRGAFVSHHLMDKKESAMANLPRWKDIFREPNAAGWIGLLLLVLAIGAATLLGSGSGSDKPAAVSQASDRP